MNRLQLNLKLRLLIPEQRTVPLPTVLQLSLLREINESR